MYDSICKVQQSGLLFAVAEREEKRRETLACWLAGSPTREIKEEEASIEPSALQWLKAGATVTSGWAI